MVPDSQNFCRLSLVGGGYEKALALGVVEGGEVGVGGGVGIGSYQEGPNFAIYTSCGSSQKNWEN